MECKFLVIWGENLSSTAKEKFNRTELAIVKLPNNIKHVVIGLVLSDGWLEHRRKNARLGFAQSLDHFEYIWFVFSLLSHYCSSYPMARNRTTINKKKSAIQIYTRSMPCFTELYSFFYPNGVKIIPDNIYNMLTPIALAHLIMGDAAALKYRLLICTDSYSIKDVVKLMNVLIIKYRLECSCYNPLTKPRIYIRSQSMPILRDVVKPYMTKSMLYKIGL